MKSEMNRRVPITVRQTLRVWTSAMILTAFQCVVFLMIVIVIKIVIIYCAELVLWLLLA